MKTSTAAAGAKHYLQSIARMDELIKRKQQQVYELEARACRVNSELKQDRVQNSALTGSHETLLVRIVDLQYELNADIDRYVDLRKESMALIDQLEDQRHVALLYARYLEGKTWEQIAVDMCYSYRWVHRLHGRALQALNRILEKSAH